MRRAQFEAAAVPLMGSLYSAALYLARRPEDAQDLLQDTYLRAYRNFEDFAPGTNCKAWMLTILHSIFVNKARRAQREPVALTIEELEERYQRWLRNTPESSPPPEGQSGPQAGLGPRLSEILDQLPEAFRSAVVLVDVQELSYEEAAAALDCPVGTVRSRLFRARRLLSAALRAYAEETGHVRGPKKKE